MEYCREYNEDIGSKTSKGIDSCKTNLDVFSSSKTVSTQSSDRFSSQSAKLKLKDSQSSKNMFLSNNDSLKVDCKLKKAKRADSTLDDKVLLPITGIDEADKDEEESPSSIEKKQSALPCIYEEDKHYILPKKCEHNKWRKISEVLDKMEIYQVFPSEVNSMRLAMAIKRKNSFVPKLALGKNHLLAKRHSCKSVPGSKLSIDSL